MRLMEHYKAITASAIRCCALQALLVAVTSASAYAILPQSKAQIQATEADTSMGISNDIGSVLDTNYRGATGTQALTVRNTTLNASATTEVGTTAKSLKLLSSISQSTSSNSTPDGGLSATASYSVTSAAEFRDILDISVDTATSAELFVHLGFRLTGGPLTATAPNAGSSAAMSGEVRISLDGETEVDRTGSTSGDLGVFNGSDQTFDVYINFFPDQKTLLGPEVQLDVLLYLGGSLSTFYTASNSASYQLVLDDVSVTDISNSPVSGVNVIGDSGYVYLGSASSPEGNYSARVPASLLKFTAGIEEDVAPASTDLDSDYKATFNLNYKGSKFKGSADVDTIGPMTFGETKKRKLKLKRKNKTPLSLSLTLKKKGSAYQIAGKIEEQGKSPVSFVAKEKS